ncbi:capsular exopolysaccharide synthesis family protein [Thermosediminibacter litoriperuensis]|uniref:non-specific protein-tyrosine kinase n=2 Tax=Thermosediminibacter litoriperuensis TaxID=291989 RepID=A0A5S5ALW4_9FIRM|nr:capsular exopolysaccharide synthesis family protein [Thermosediminibacter litoriperuensis]
MGLFIMTDPKSIVSEAFRVLRTNLHFSGIDRPLRKVMITSSIPGEGKSTIVSNLAVCIANTGSKVLLVDADLRRPQIYKFFLLENYKGLSNLLAEDLPLDTVVNTTKVENLHVITSGPVPPNPAEVLGSAKMKKFLDEVASVYDMVLIDAPPVNSVADASILSALVDGVILVVEESSTEREAAIAAKQQLEKVNARILGVVLNKVKQKDGGYYYYYYYYGEDNKRVKKRK